MNLARQHAGDGGRGRVAQRVPEAEDADHGAIRGDHHGAPAVGSVSALLADGGDVSGRFTITSDPALGTMRGDYRVARSGDTVDVTVTPSGDWTSNERTWSVRFVYAVTRVFRTWPTTYVWHARIDLVAAGGPSMVSRWERVSE